jgi:hypothetical protein
MVITSQDVLVDNQSHGKNDGNVNGKPFCLVDDAQVVLLDSPNGKLTAMQLNATMHTEIEQERTISVASTRVPTIFNRTRVFFSMICAKVSRHITCVQNDIPVHPRRTKVD